MFKLVTDEFGEVEVTFKHYGGSRDRNGATVCYVTNDYKVFVYGQANCSREDQYCKETGRQISLKRAIRELKEKHLATMPDASGEAKKQAALHIDKMFWDAYWFTKERDRAKAKSIAECKKIVDVMREKDIHGKGLTHD